MTLRLAIITLFGTAECYHLASTGYRSFKYLRETWNLYGACNKVLAAWFMPPTLVATAKDGRIIDLVKREPEFLVVKLNCRCWSAFDRDPVR